MGIWEFIWKRLREGLFGFSELSESPCAFFCMVWESALMWRYLRGENVSSEGELGGKEEGG